MQKITKTNKNEIYKLFYGTIIHTPTMSWIEIHPYTLLGVNSEGTIDYIEINHKSNEPLNYFAKLKNMDKEKIDFQNYSENPFQFFLPGFIDTHIHASQYPNIGAGLGVPLLEWLKKYTYSLESSFNHKNKSMAEKIYRKVIGKTLNNGTTCASYFATIDLDTTKLFTDLLIEYGQRAFVGKVCMDLNETYPEYCETFKKSMETSEKMIAYIEEKAKMNRHGDDLITPVITPRFAPSCSEALLEALGQLSKTRGLPIQTHISENLKEVELTKKLFPDFENYASVYDHFQLLNSKTILAHAIHLTDEECNIIKEKKCSISHCPTSNSFICSGEAPIKKYLTKGINVSLGTDVSGGFEISVLGLMKYSILVSNHLAMKEGDKVKLNIGEALYMATHGGAKAVGLGDRIGTFEVGKQWDAQLICLDAYESNVDVFEWQVPKSGDWRKMEDLLGKWIFTGDDRNCRKVWVNGNLVVDKNDHWVLVK